MSTWEERMAERAFRRALIRAANPSAEERLQQRWREWVSDRDGWGGRITKDGEFIHEHASHRMFYPPTEGSSAIIVDYPLMDARTGESIGRSSNCVFLGPYENEGSPCRICAEFEPNDWA